jgi:hypothetical protein
MAVYFLKKPQKDSVVIIITGLDTVDSETGLSLLDSEIETPVEIKVKVLGEEVINVSRVARVQDYDEFLKVVGKVKEILNKEEVKNE